MSGGHSLVAPGPHAQACASFAGEIEFGEFLQVFESQQEAMAKLSDETDTIEAFVALGGNADKSGSISAEKLSRLCKARALF